MFIWVDLCLNGSQIDNPQKVQMQSEQNQYVCLVMQAEIAVKISKLQKEKDFLQQTSESLLRNQDDFRTQLAAEQAKVKTKDAQIAELTEQVSVCHAIMGGVFQSLQLIRPKLWSTPADYIDFFASCDASAAECKPVRVSAVHVKAVDHLGKKPYVR